MRPTHLTRRCLSAQTWWKLQTYFSSASTRPTCLTSHSRDLAEAAALVSSCSVVDVPSCGNVCLVSFDAAGNLTDICPETEQVGEQQCDTLMSAQPNMVEQVATTIFSRMQATC